MSKFIQIILALLTMAVMIWAIWQGYLLLNQEQLGLHSSHRSMAIIFSIMALVIAYMLTMAIGYHGDKYLKGQHFAFRYNLYETLLALYSSVSDELQDVPGSKLNLEIRNLEQQLQLIASAKVLKAFNELQRLFTVDGVNSVSAKEARRKLILTMREDLGQSADYQVRKEFQHMLK